MLIERNIKYSSAVYIPDQFHVSHLVYGECKYILLPLCYCWYLVRVVGVDGVIFSRSALRAKLVETVNPIWDERDYKSKKGNG